MLWYILLGSITIGVSIYVWYTNKKIAPAFYVPMLIGAFVTAFLGSIANEVAQKYVGSTPQSYHVCELQAMNPTTTGSGSFFLGSGNYTNGPSYMYYCKDGVGFRAYTINAGAAWIIEDGGEGNAFPQPVVRGNKATTNNKWLALWTDDVYLTEFHIPPGSVRSDYVVN